MPEGVWNHPGTKQGVYMMGPQGEYLEGGGAISGNAKQVTERLERALERWKKLRREKKYRHRPVPEVASSAPPEVLEHPFILRAHLRDLPRAEGDDSGRRFRRADRDGLWMDFVRWAWNVNWIGFENKLKTWRTKSSKPVAVDEAVVHRIAREILKDNVRGQQPDWPAEALKSASLTKRRLGARDGKITYEYRGRAEMRTDSISYVPELYGQAVWDTRRKRFLSFDIVAVGPRQGAGTFNQRRRDLGPAPMGIALGLYTPPPTAKKK